MRICVISSLGEQTYQGKYINKKSIWSDFWDLALFQNDIPVDVVDYYELKYQNANILKNIDNSYSRHIYTNGILLVNRLLKHYEKIELLNSINNVEALIDFDIVVISTNYVFNDWIENLHQILFFLKKHKIKCIVGGIGIKRLYLEKSSKFSSLKNIIDGYIIISDSGIPKLIWATSHLKEIKDNVLFCEEEYQPDINDYSLLNIETKLHPHHSTFATQSGCLFNCAFCTYKEKHEKHTYYNSDIVKKSLLSLYTSGNKLKHLRIVDETFNTSIIKAIDFCNFVSSQRFGFTWSCFLRANNINLPLVKALSKSKCNLVSIGVESGSSFMQKIMNKNIDLVKLSHNIKMLQAYGIKVNISLLVGFFNESKETINETIKYIKTSTPDFARINIWYPSIVKSNESLFITNKFKTFDNSWEHASMSEKQAIDAAKRIYLSDSSTIFIPPFTSIFDQWPVLASYSLTSDEIYGVFKEYYELSKLKK
jgi:hypothetical protein